MLFVAITCSLGASSLTSTSLFTQLEETWPVEVVEPYGEVLVIPSKAFKPEWKTQLENENVRIYAQGYRGETCFFLKEKT